MHGRQQLRQPERLRQKAPPLTPQLQFLVLLQFHSRNHQHSKIPPHRLQLLRQLPPRPPRQIKIRHQQIDPRHAAKDLHPPLRIPRTEHAVPLMFQKRPRQPPDIRIILHQQHHARQHFLRRAVSGRHFKPHHRILLSIGKNFHAVRYHLAANQLAATPSSAFPTLKMDSASRRRVASPPKPSHSPRYTKPSLTCIKTNAHPHPLHPPRSHIPRSPRRSPFYFHHLHPRPRQNPRVRRPRLRLLLRRRPHHRLHHPSHTQRHHPNGCTRGHPPRPLPPRRRQ